MQTYRISVGTAKDGEYREYTERASRLGVAVDRAITKFADEYFGMNGVRIPNDGVHTTLTISIRRVG